MPDRSRPDRPPTDPITEQRSLSEELRRDAVEGIMIYPTIDWSIVPLSTKQVYIPKGGYLLHNYLLYQETLGAHLSSM